MPTELSNPVIPPSAKFAPPEPPPAEAEKPKGEEPPVDPGKGKPDSAREMSERIGDKINESRKKPATEPEVEKTSEANADPALNKAIEDETKGMAPKEKAAWTRLRYENRDYARKVKEAESATAKIADLEGKLVEASKGAETPAELEPLRTKLAELEKILAVKDVEATSQFQETVAKPIKGIEDMVRALGVKYNVAENDILNALNNNTEKRSDLLSEIGAAMNEVDRYDLYHAARAVKDLRTKGDAFRANAKEEMAKLDAQSKSAVTRETQEQAEMRSKAHKTGWEALQKAVPVLSPAEGDDDVTKAWNAELVKSEKFARESNFNQFDMGSQVAIMHRAAVYPMLVGAVTSLQTELKNAQAEVQKLRGSRPGAGGGVAANERQTRKSGPDDFVERVNQRLAKIGV